MQRLREKMIAKRLNSAPASIAPPHLDPELAQAGQVPISQEAFIPPNELPGAIESDSSPMIPKLEDVDFKYLSELIHRVNQSDARSKLAALPFNLNDDLKELQKIKSQQSRRNLNPYNVEPAYTEANSGYNQHRHLHKQGTPDDAYYTNLGRQIASMIRSADSRIDQQFNAEIDQTVRPLPFHPVINEKNFAPRSYWERSVRSSPLTEMDNYNSYLDKSRTLRQSNENSLFNLENEVESFASTTSPLSLRDLENILNTMEKAHAHIKYTNPLKFTKHSNYSLNVSLLPKYVRPENKYRRVFQSPDPAEYVQPSHAPASRVPPPHMPPIRVMLPDVVPPKKSMERNASNVTVFLPQRTNIVVPLNDYWMYNSHNNLRPLPITQQSKPVLQENPVYNSNPTQSPVNADAVPNESMAKKPHGEYLQFLRSKPVVKNTTPKRPHPKLLSSPPAANYKNLNYFSGNKHHYMFESASYPLQVPLKRQINKQFGKRNPSYFHHELHHFDYFD